MTNTKGGRGRLPLAGRPGQTAGRAGRTAGSGGGPSSSGALQVSSNPGVGKSARVPGMHALGGASQRAACDDAQPQVEPPTLKAEQEVAGQLMDLGQ